jgi:hypothetical protein
MKKNATPPNPKKNNIATAGSADRVEITFKTVSTSTTGSSSDGELRLYLVAGSATFPLTGCTTTDPDGPIVANCSVPYIGAFLRVLIDKGMFESASISAICRKVGKLFRTRNQEQISAHSLRNHIDNPSPKHLEQLQFAFRTHDKYIDRLIQISER